MTICPSCGSDELYLIGAVLRGKSGTRFEGGAIGNVLASIGPEIYEGLLICKSCKHQTTTRITDELGQLAETDCMWEITALGTKLPVVCPVCGNRKIFTKVVLEQRTRAVTYAANKDGRFSPIDQGVVLRDAEQLTLRYICDVETCTGTVTINDENKYTLKRD